MENHGTATKNIARQPGSRPRKKQARAGGTKPGPPKLPSWGCAGTAGFCNSRRLLSCLGGHVLRPTRGSSSPRRCPRRSRTHQSELGFEQQNRFRNLREIQRIEKKAFRPRADAAQSARQGGTEPGTTRFRDGRRTTGPPAPRRGPGAPTAQPRPRGPDLESAQV